jgi:hypothetical protein
MKEKTKAEMNKGGKIRLGTNEAGTWRKVRKRKGGERKEKNEQKNAAIISHVFFIFMHSSNVHEIENSSTTRYDWVDYINDVPCTYLSFSWLWCRIYGAGVNRGAEPMQFKSTPDTM